jgi:hypothetical protein
VDGTSVWIASEYIAHACDYTSWGGPFFAGGSGDNLLGTCGGTNHGPGARAALGNWSTRISQLRAIHLSRLRFVRAYRARVVWRGGGPS